MKYSIIKATFNVNTNLSDETGYKTNSPKSLKS
ncbi:hypothetical protein AAKU52_003261 [Pedobacter sp. CG_S7]